MRVHTRMHVLMRMHTCVCAHMQHACACPTAFPHACVRVYIRIHVLERIPTCVRARAARPGGPVTNNYGQKPLPMFRTGERVAAQRKERSPRARARPGPGDEQL